jgi:anaerobic selenocysteine-containing dehydrogenase
MLEGIGLDPLPACMPVDEADERFSLILVTGDREKSYHHSRFRDQGWALKVSPDPKLTMHPETARRLGVEDRAWVTLEVMGGKGPCRLRVSITDETPPNVVNTGMGWWLPGQGPEYGALDININAALDYSGPWDPVSGSSNVRGMPCRVEAIRE